MMHAQKTLRVTETTRRVETVSELVLLAQKTAVILLLDRELEKSHKSWMQTNASC